MLRQKLAALCSGMFSDELDKMGHRSQVIDGLSANWKHGKFYGPVRTTKLQTMETDDENISQGLGFLESLHSGEILCVEGSPAFAYFGELMSRLALRQKLGGVVIGGLTRDSSFTQDIRDLVIFSEGYSPRDIKGRGRVEATDVPIVIQDVPIHPGDWIFGDSDGVVVIPLRLKEELEQRIERILTNEAEIIRFIDEGKGIVEILKNFREF